jgi:hypothetical protein
MTPSSTESIVASMLAAVHRRDHGHPDSSCRPHQVEVIHLGNASIAVCHDCSFESEFLSMRDCERTAGDHRMATA